MSLSLRCPHCHAAFEFPDSAEGRKVGCPDCRHTWTAARPPVPVEQVEPRVTPAGWALFGVLATGGIALLVTTGVFMTSQGVTAGLVLLLLIAAGLLGYSWQVLRQMLVVGVLFVVGCGQVAAPVPPPVQQQAQVKQPANIVRIGDLPGRMKWVTDTLQVRFLYSSIDWVSYYEFGRYEVDNSSPKYHVVFDISNAHATRQTRYRGWQDDFQQTGLPRVKLEDEHGNTYRQVRYNGTVQPFIVRRGDQSQAHYRCVTTWDLRPGYMTTDFLIFERPVDAAKTLTLTLPADNLGHRGEFKLQFPAAPEKPPTPPTPVEEEK